VGDSNRSDGAATVPYTIQVASVNVKQNQMTVGVKGPEGKVIASLNLDPTGKDTVRSKFTESPGRPKNPNGVYDGLFDLSFTPKDPGRYVVMIFLDKKPIAGSPVTIDVGTSPYASSAVGATTTVETTKTVSPRAVAPAPATSAPTIQAKVAEEKAPEKKPSKHKHGEKKKKPSSPRSGSGGTSSSSGDKQRVEVVTNTRTITRVTVGKSFTIRLAVAGSGGAPADAPIKQNGKVIDKGKAKPGANDTYEVTWIPTHAGVFQTNLVINGVDVGGSAFEFEAFNAPITCRPVANSDNIGPGLPCTITFAIDGATPSKLSAKIRGSDGKLGTDVSTKKRSDGTWDVNFRPPDSPSFAVELVADSTAVENKLTIQLV